LRFFHSQIMVYFFFFSPFFSFRISCYRVYLFGRSRHVFRRKSFPIPRVFPFFIARVFTPALLPLFFGSLIFVLSLCTEVPLRLFCLCVSFFPEAPLFRSCVPRSSPHSTIQTRVTSLLRYFGPFVCFSRICEALDPKLQPPFTHGGGFPVRRPLMSPPSFFCPR